MCLYPSVTCPRMHSLASHLLPSFMCGHYRPFLLFLILWLCQLGCEAVPVTQPAFSWDPNVEPGETDIALLDVWAGVSSFADAVSGQSWCSMPGSNVIRLPPASLTPSIPLLSALWISTQKVALVDLRLPTCGDCGPELLPFLHFRKAKASARSPGVSRA